VIDMQAALVVGGLIVALAAPALWWVFFRMDEKSPFPDAPEAPPRTMCASDVARIEQALHVVLPWDYAAFVQQEERPDIDATSVFDDADLVIEQTRAYRAGAYGLRPWPPQLVCIGDEDDASPRVIDCSTGACWRLEKGSLDNAFERFPTFAAFVAYASDED
jgi:hypothetical protein